MAWVAVIGLAIGAMGSASSSKGAKKAAQQEAAFRDRELRVAEAQEGRANQLWNEYQTTYLPRERELVAEAFDEENSPEAAAARATSSVRQATANAQQMSLRNARRLGINPTSGAYAGLDNASQIGQIGLEAASRDNARRVTKNDNFNKKTNVLSLGRNLPATAGTMTSQAGQAYAGATMAASRETDRWNDLAAASGQQMGYYAGQLADWYRNRNKTTTEPQQQAA